MTTTFKTSRTLAAPPARVYAAFANAQQLAAWWGPSGFTNEFAAFDFQAGGVWSFVMVGPGGARYQNDNVFGALVPNSRVVIQHPGAPCFELTVALDAAPSGGTLLTWAQTFEDPAVAAAVEHVVVPSNEQNLDRLAALLAAPAVPAA